MKKILLIISLFACNLAHAELQANGITVINRTNVPLSYHIDATRWLNNGYLDAVPANGYDVSHNYFDISDATIRSGTCAKIDWPSVCKVPGLTAIDCTGGQHYNGNLIKTIEIVAYGKCVVTCKDGTRTSCKK
jgi:hypothetical protein